MQRRIDRVTLQLIATYGATLTLWLVAVYWYARVGRVVILSLGLLMWVVGAVTAYLIREKAGHIAARTRYMVGGYAATLLLYRFMHGLFFSISPADWGTALGADLPLPLTNTGSGWLETLLVIVLISVPAAYMTWIAQLYMVHRGRARVDEAFNRYQRRNL